MMTITTYLLVAASAVALTLGVVLVGLAYRAYRRTELHALRSLAVGIGLIALGQLFVGGVYRFLGTGLEEGILVQSVLTALGFGLLVSSLYSPGDRAPAGGGSRGPGETSQRRAADPTDDGEPPSSDAESLG